MARVAIIALAGCPSPEPMRVETMAVKKADGALVALLGAASGGDLARISDVPRANPKLTGARGVVCFAKAGQILDVVKTIEEALASPECAKYLSVR